MDIISRSQSKALGLKTFFTGTKCKNENIAERRVSNKDCLCNECQKAAKNRKITWANNNKNKIKQYELNNKEKREKQRKEWELENKEKMSSYSKVWRLNNKEKVYEWNNTRRADKMLAVPVWYNEFDEFVMQEAFHLSEIRTKLFKIKWHVDHMIPLKAKEACGLHCASNIQVIPQKLNNIKVNKMMLTNPFEWVYSL